MSRSIRVKKVYSFPKLGMSQHILSIRAQKKAKTKPPSILS